ncbi:MAG: hypothetical protein GKR94_23000 [Gammaproteobacteria bacterium]|nr:hypothetical protein [Gammaproteobacteria bacterium]
MRRVIQSTVILLVLLMVASKAAAERWYTIEVLIFKQASLAQGFEVELWPETAEEPRDGLVLGRGGSVRSLNRSGSVQRVPRVQLAYGGTAARLRHAGYTPLVHTGWRQPGIDRDRSLLVAVAGGSGNSNVRGTVRVSLSKYLQVDAHLLFEHAHYADAAFILREQRRMRSGEMHYFDHPLFAMLMRIIPYEPPGGEYIPAAEPAAPKESAPNEPDEITPAKTTQ